MRHATYLLLVLSILTSGCQEEDVLNLEDGEFVIELYNSQGKLLLTKRGEAENIGHADGWEIRLLDNPLIPENNSDPSGSFASFTFWGENSIKTPQRIQLNKGARAGFNQHWYSLSDDWGYSSTKGTLYIASVEGLKIKGSFQVNLEVADHAQQNPPWGERIFVKGYFSSI